MKSGVSSGANAINDLPNVANQLDFILFADDTNMYVETDDFGFNRNN